MSRKTKIRKRIFGVTSLILALLVASIPTHSLAALITDPTANLHLATENMPATAIGFGLTADSKDGTDMHVNDPGQASGSTYRNMTVVVSPATVGSNISVQNHTVGESPLLASDLTGHHYTDFNLYHLEYIGNYSHNGTNRVIGWLPYLSANQWGTGTTVALHLEDLGKVLTKPDYWGEKFNTKYGQQPRALFYQSTETDLNGTYKTDPIPAASFSWELISDFDTNIPTKSGVYYDTWERIETSFQKWFFAIVYRSQMNVEEGRNTAAADFPQGVPMASFASHGDNSSYKLYLSEVLKDTVLKKSILQNAIETQATPPNIEAYYEFSARLLDSTNTDPSTYEAGYVLGPSSGSPVGISVPLPAKMNYLQDGWELYVRDSETGTTTNIPTTEYDYVPLGTGNYALQFELDFGTSTNVASRRYYDVGLVKTKADPTPPTPQPTEYTIEATSNNTTFGGFSWTGSNASATSNTGSGDKLGPITVLNADTVQVTAQPKTGYEFTGWTVTAGQNITTLTNPVLDLSVANINNATERKITLTANFRDPSVPLTPATLTVQSSNASYGTVSPAVTAEAGHNLGETVSLTATPASVDYIFTGWSWTDATGVAHNRMGTGTNNAFSYVIDNTNAVVTGNFSEAVRPEYQLTIEDSRNHQYLMPLSYDTNGKLITPDVQKKLGELYSNTVVRVSDTVTGVQQGHIDQLKNYLYNTLFHIEVDGDIRDGAGNYTVTITDLPLPNNMDENKGKISLFRLDGTSDLVPCGVVTSGTGYATFDVSKSGNYAFTYETDKTKNQLHVNDLRQPKPGASSMTAFGDNILQLDSDRTLRVTDSSADVSTYAEGLKTTLESGGTVVYGGHDEYHVSLIKRTPNVDPITGQPVRDAEGNITYTENQVEDINELKLSLPVRTNYANAKIDVFRVSDDGAGNVTPGAQINPADITVSQIDGTTQLVSFTEYAPDYNSDYIFMFQKQPALQVDETNREDKPAIDTTVKQNPAQLRDDRWLIIETSRGDVITPLIRADAELGRQENGQYLYKIIPYNIRYVDSAGNDVTDFTNVRVELGIPEAAKNKFNLDLVAVKNGALEKQLVYENQTTDVYTFTTDHFSEHALVYMENQPTPTPGQFNIRIGSITPANAGTTSGAGSYPANTNATLSANPAAGFTFQRWTDEQGNELSTNNPWTFNVTGDRTVNAVFTPATTPGGTFNVTAIANPTAGGTVTGGGTNLPAGQPVTLTATPAQGYTVQSWIDNAVANPSTATTYTINNLDRDHSVIVEFVQSGSGGGATTGPTVTANATTEGGSASAVPNADGSWTLTANPATGYTFSGWRDPSGNIVSTANPYTFTPTANTTLTAVFTPTSQGTTPGTSNNVTVNQDTQGSTTPSSQGKSNSTDMPKTGLFDQFGTYKMIAIILLVLFGAIELLGTVNTKKQRVPVQS